MNTITETTNHRGTGLRPFPAEMWTEILKAEATAADKQIPLRVQLREAILEIARKHGFSEQECISCGLIHPPRKPPIRAARDGTHHQFYKGGR